LKPPPGLRVVLCSNAEVRVRACSVSQNCLAEAYIAQQLSADDRIHPMNLNEYARVSPADRRNVVLVIDQLGLEVPLSECLRQLREPGANAKFLVLGNDKSTEEITRLLIMGVHGYVRHADVPRTLIRAILCLAAGQLWVSHEAFRQFLSEAGRALRKDTRTLQATTPREDEILELVRRRLSNREIAELLQIRVSTVKFHLSNILSKLHAHSRRELAGTPGAYLLTKAIR
jgi:NarL family two-component system response regulator LiaR